MAAQHMLELPALEKMCTEASSKQVENINAVERRSSVDTQPRPESILFQITSAATTAGVTPDEAAVRVHAY